MQINMLFISKTFTCAVKRTYEIDILMNLRLAYHIFSVS